MVLKSKCSEYFNKIHDNQWPEVFSETLEILEIWGDSDLNMFLIGKIEVAESEGRQGKGGARVRRQAAVQPSPGPAMLPSLTQSSFKELKSISCYLGTQQWLRISWKPIWRSKAG